VSIKTDVRAPTVHAICGNAPVQPPRDARGESSARNDMLAAMSAPMATPIRARITSSSE
jgi:hypothetical protein